MIVGLSTSCSHGGTCYFLFPEMSSIVVGLNVFCSLEVFSIIVGLNVFCSLKCLSSLWDLAFSVL